MVGEADLVAFPRCVNNKVWGRRNVLRVSGRFARLVRPYVRATAWRVTVVEVEQEAAHVLVINFPPAIGLILRDDLEKQTNRGALRPRQGGRSPADGARQMAPSRRRQRTSPQYSEMKSFFWTGSLMKIPHPATSDGASSRC